MNKEELFNLRHASLCNIIECIFGVLKHRFHILLLPIEYDLKIQARLPAALCALHNFMRTHDNAEEVDSNSEMQEAAPLAAEAIGVLPQEGADMGRFRDDIAQAMWNDYQQLLAQRASLGEDAGEDMGGDYEDEDEGEDFEGDFEQDSGNEE